MNRILSQPAAPAAPEVVRSADVSFGRISSDPGAEPHAVFAPVHYEANYAYPLLIWLHGPSDDERQLRRIMADVSLRNYVAIAPRGTLPSSPTVAQTGYTWGQSAEDIQAAEQRVWQCVEQVSQKYHIHEGRVFLAGYAAGGTMALRLALRNPERCAGVASLFGPLPRGQRPLARLHELRRFPMLLAAAREGMQYPHSRLSTDLRLLHAAGMDISVRQYQGSEALSNQMLGDIDRWLMELVTTPR